VKSETALLFTSRAIRARRSIGVMNTTHAPVSLPAPHDYSGAAGTLHDAHDAIEAIEWRLQRVVDAYERDDQLEQAPQLDDVGALWAFVDDVDRLTKQLVTKRDELRRTLATVNLMRLDSGAELTGTMPTGATPAPQA
jgi:hypothetical protein